MFLKDYESLQNHWDIYIPYNYFLQCAFFTLHMAGSTDQNVYQTPWPYFFPTDFHLMTVCIKLPLINTAADFLKQKQQKL